MKDLNIGKVYGNFTVLKREGNNGGYKQYECECNQCGKKVLLCTHNFKRTKCECECEKKKKGYVGKVYGDFKVIRRRRIKVKPNYVYFDCECTRCGSKKILTNAQLRYTLCKCECSKQEQDITLGKVFGDLKVIERTDSRDLYNRLKYKCVCEHCGKVYYKTRFQLVCGGTLCYCNRRLGRVYGDMKIVDVVENEFEKGYTYEYECIHCKERKLMNSHFFHSGILYCTCKEKEKVGKNLTQYSKERRIGKTYGDFKVLSCLEKKHGEYWVYGCECIHCGKKLEINCRDLEYKIGVCSCKERKGNNHEKNKNVR